MKNILKNRQLVLKKWIRVALFFVLFLLACISIVMIYIGERPIKKNDVKYFYNIKENLDYKVYLKENEFFEEKYLGPGKQYTTEIIDYIDVDMKYNFNGSDKTNMNYKYDVSGTIIGEYENAQNGNAELWKKNYVLVPEQSKNKEDLLSFDVNQNLKINYSEYSRIVDRFKSKFKLAIDAYLDVKLNISYSGKINNSSSIVSGNDVLEIKIPLSKNTIKIDTKYDKERHKQLNEENIIVKDSKKIRTGTIMLVCSIAMFLILLPRIFVSRKNEYTKKLEKIMKDYSEIIAEVESELTYDDLEIIDIKKFEDMIDIEEELKSPILHYEMIENKESWFVIATDKYLYRFILRK